MIMIRIYEVNPSSPNIQGQIWPASATAAAHLGDRNHLFYIIFATRFRREPGADKPGTDPSSVDAAQAVVRKGGQYLRILTDCVDRSDGHTSHFAR